MSAFPTSCFILSAVNDKIEKHACIKCCIKLGKSAAETLEMLCEAFGEHPFIWTAAFLMVFVML
jgi:hypothetical protein